MRREGEKNKSGSRKPDYWRIKCRGNMFQGWDRIDCPFSYVHSGLGWHCTRLNWNKRTSNKQNWRTMIIMSISKLFQCSVIFTIQRLLTNRTRKEFPLLQSTGHFPCDNRFSKEKSNGTADFTEDNDRNIPERILTENGTAWSKH